jgi:hypothetical protein
MRKITIDCALCQERVPLEHGKEAMFVTGSNAYHLMDLCPACLDTQLKAAESVNDTSGYRQTAAALIKLPNGDVPSAASG